MRRCESPEFLPTRRKYYGADRCGDVARLEYESDAPPEVRMDLQREQRRGWTTNGTSPYRAMLSVPAAVVRIRTDPSKPASPANARLGGTPPSIPTISKTAARQAQFVQN